MTYYAIPRWISHENDALNEQMKTYAWQKYHSTPGGQLSSNGVYGTFFYADSFMTLLKIIMGLNNNFPQLKYLLDTWQIIKVTDVEYVSPYVT